MTKENWTKGCIAQIDLTQFAAANVELEIPHKGGLTFFASTAGFSNGFLKGAVRPVTPDQMGEYDPPVRLSPPDGVDCIYNDFGKSAVGYQDTNKTRLSQLAHYLSPHNARKPSA